MRARTVRRNSTAHEAGRGFRRRLAGFITAIGTFLAEALIWLTSKRGGVRIIIGVLVVYFTLLSAEGYWQALNSANPPFLPKPFINDGAQLERLWSVGRTTSFWLAFFFSLAIQAIQAYVIREIGVARAKAAYEAVADYRVPELDEDALDIAEHRRRQYKNAGMSAVRQRGVVITIVYLVDGLICHTNYPLFALRLGQFVINLVWFFASLVGTEGAINLYLDASEKKEEDDTQEPQVEILE